MQHDENYYTVCLLKGMLELINIKNKEYNKNASKDAFLWVFWVIQDKFKSNTGEGGLHF